MQKKVVFILGPTASGKTVLAVKLAKKFNGEIISADSRQIYLGLDVGTGKDLEEYGKVKYHLIDICIPGEKFTLFDWLNSAREKLEEIWGKNKLPIVVGGTGLYAKALADGYRLSQISNLKSNNFAVASTRRLFSRIQLDKMPIGKLREIYHRLSTTDLKLDLNNPRRLIRAIEKAQSGETTSKQKPNFENLILAIDVPRKKLYQKIDQRVDIRFEKKNMLSEVKNLLKSGVSAEWLESLGLEYKFITKYLHKELDWDEMVQELKWKSHAYARRQLTWLRKQHGLIWIDDYSQVEKHIIKFLN